MYNGPMIIYMDAGNTLSVILCKNSLFTANPHHLCHFVWRV